MPEFIGNYTTSPNAEILGLLSQENEAARNRAARFADSGGYAGAGSSVNIQDLLGAVANTDDRAVRQRYMDMMFKRMENRDALGMAQAKTDMDMQAMEQVAKKKMQLHIQQVALNAKLALLGEEGRPEIEAQLQKVRDEATDLSSREIAAQAALAQRNPEVAREWATRQRELKTTYDAQSEFRKRVDGTADPVEFLKEFHANPSKGGLPAKSLLQKFGAIPAGEGIVEMFTGDVIDDRRIEDALKESPAFRELSSAAAQVPAFMGAMRAGTKTLPSFFSWLDGSSVGQYFEGQPYLAGVQGPNTAEAQKFAAKMLSDFAIKSLVNTGMNVDVPGSTPAVQKLMGELLDLSSSANIKPEEMSDRVYKALQDASLSIFGPVEGTKGVSKLADAMDVMLQKVAGLSGQMTAGIMSEGGKIGIEQIRNAASAYAFGRASQARNVLRTGTQGRIFTADQLQSVLGGMEGAYNPATRTLDVGLLPIDEQTQTGNAMRALLGKGLTGNLQDLMALTRSTKATEAKSALRKVELEKEKRRLESELTGKARRSGLKAEIDMLDRLLGQSRETGSTDLMLPSD